MMIRIVLDDSSGDKLATVGRCVELCDRSGRTLGIFTPAVTGALEPRVSDQELLRREQADETFSTQEIRQHLQNL